MDQNPFFNKSDSFKNEDIETETKKSNQSTYNKSKEMSEVRS